MPLELVQSHHQNNLQQHLSSLFRWAPFLQIFGAAVACAEKLQVDLDRLSSIDGFSSTSGKTLSPVRDTIAFENMTFHNPSRPTVDVLQDVSIHFPPGKCTAIEGLSGRGKSTIDALIGKLYDPIRARLFLMAMISRILMCAIYEATLGLYIKTLGF